MGEPEAVLSTHDLTKRFGAFVATSGVSLSVREGDIYGLLGLNGAGKTTTLRMVLGLLRPTSGSIRVLGEEVRFGRPQARQRLGAFIEGPSVYPQLTALENLELLARLGSGAESEDRFDRTAALDILNEVGLQDAVHRRARTFSLGMRQRLGIALALAPDPDLVILDEPTNGLDPRGIRDIRRLIQRLNADRGLTFVVSSHLLHEVENLCDRVGIMHAGELLDEGPLEDLMEQGVRTLVLEADPAERVREVLGERYDDELWFEERGGFKITTGPEDASDLCRSLVEGGVRVHSIVPRRPSLEELFIARTEEIR